MNRRCFWEWVKGPRTDLLKQSFGQLSTREEKARTVDRNPGRRSYIVYQMPGRNIYDLRFSRRLCTSPIVDRRSSIIYRISSSGQEHIRFTICDLRFAIFKKSLLSSMAENYLSVTLKGFHNVLETEGTPASRSRGTLSYVV